ncbi:MAG: hypothetical protein L7F78_18030, partial [Syntrophales bacterium LBB04]|nr:hypothetical protein [Syntrophales bacterium LBB04]
IVPYTGTLYGYFATLHHKNPFQDAFLNYQSSYSPGEFYNGSGNDDIEGNFRAHGVLNTADYLKSTGVGGSGSDEAYIGGQSGEWGTHWNGVEHWVGQNDYAQWGYWQAETSTSFTVGSNTYSLVNDQGWFVMAKHITTATEIAAIASGDYNYKGEAHGTYYNGSATAQLSGTFDSTVHFGSASVKNFDLNVSGGGHSATYSWSGTQSITTSSSGNCFALPSNAGTSKIDGTSVSYNQVSGSLVGSGAQGMIGGWGMASSSTGVGAAGIYSGIVQK